MSSGRRGGIPGPESRTGLVRPAMTEAEFERRLSGSDSPRGSSSEVGAGGWSPPAPDPADSESPAPAPLTVAEAEPAPRSQGTRSGSSRASSSRSRPAARPRRVQRMFAVEEELDKKLWLYAIHVGKDRSDVVNDLLRPLVGSMVLYDSRERRSGRAAEADQDN